MVVGPVKDLYGQEWCVGSGLGMTVLKLILLRGAWPFAFYYETKSCYEPTYFFHTGYRLFYTKAWFCTVTTKKTVKNSNERDILAHTFTVYKSDDTSNLTIIQSNRYNVHVVFRISFRIVSFLAPCKFRLKMRKITWSFED